MRKQPTWAEHVLWQALRRDALHVRFRRQHPIGPFIADFYCDSVGLVIEVDGDVHDLPAQIDHDRMKERYLKAHGYHLVRFRNDDVLYELDHVLSAIEQEIAVHEGGK